MLVIIDYQAGNQTSVQRAFNHLGLETIISDDPLKMGQADGLVFPGVGAAGQAMELLRQKKLDETIRNLIEGGKPFLGICLGCQIMLAKSEENDSTTLGLIEGVNVRFPSHMLDEHGHQLKIPHMGWNSMSPTSPSALFVGLAPTDQFYFVHSYYPKPAPEYVLGLTSYGCEFASAFGREGL
ncbi:MAG: imidazole glycerol phosphate synthase subunit HisH, partial [Candidatus Adiutrix sp.]